MKSVLRSKTLVAALLGSSVAGCATPPSEGSSAATSIEAPVHAYVIEGGALQEANGYFGTCRRSGGCLLEDDTIDLDALGFADAEAREIVAAFRAGGAVLYGFFSAAQEPAGPPARGVLHVREVWRAPRAFASTARLYELRLSEDLSTIALSANGGEAILLDAVRGVKHRHEADLRNRGGLLVRGQAFVDADTQERAFVAEAYFRRWVPTAQYECDRGCDGFGSCLSCGTGRWSCDACPGQACGATACGMPPLLPEVQCPDGRTVGAECAPAADGRCGWVIETCD